jgi:rod shape-determining protein MreC
MTSVDGVRGVWSGYVALRDAQIENEALKQELQRLQVRLQEERAQAQRAENFRQLLELRERAGVDTVASEVIAGPATIEFRDMTIDKGSADGVERDMAVISPAGVVGRVILSSPRAARVQMLIDLNAAAGAMIERTRAQGLVVGQGRALKMEYVPSTSDVTQGDLVVTSGIDKIYPKGFVIGTVRSVDRGSGIFHEITIEPAVDFSRLEEVLVVTTPPPAVTAEQIAREAAEIAAATLRQKQTQTQTQTQAPPQTSTPRNASPALTAPLNASPRQPVSRNTTAPRPTAGNRSPSVVVPQNGSPQGPTT